MEDPPTNAANAAGAGGGFGGSATATNPVAGFDPVLISLIRRSMPNLVAYDLAGVQPMSNPNWINLRNEIQIHFTEWNRSILQ